MEKISDYESCHILEEDLLIVPNNDDGGMKSDDPIEQMIIVLTGRGNMTVSQFKDCFNKAVEQKVNEILILKK